MPDQFRYHSLQKSGIKIMDVVEVFDEGDGFHIKYEKFENGECFEVKMKYLSGISGEAEVDSIREISNEDFENCKMH